VSPVHERPACIPCQPVALQFFDPIPQAANQESSATWLKDNTLMQLSRQGFRNPMCCSNAPMQLVPTRLLIDRLVCRCPFSTKPQGDLSDKGSALFRRGTSTMPVEHMHHARFISWPYFTYLNQEHLLVFLVSLQSPCFNPQQVFSDLTPQSHDASCTTMHESPQHLLQTHPPVGACSDVVNVRYPRSGCQCRHHSHSCAWSSLCLLCKVVQGVRR
jgi:hypothetical protein